MKKPTIDIVARKAGVSKSTVSYVITGKRKISSDVAAKVKQAMAEVNYKPKLMPDVSERHATGLVDLYVPVLQDRLSEDFFYYPVLEGVMDALGAEHYNLVLSRKTLRGNNGSLEEFAEKQNVDGIILMNPLVDHYYIDFLQKSNIPFVIIGTPEYEQDCFYVDIDAVSASYRSAAYLMNKGHERMFMFLAPADYVFIEQMKKGFSLAYEEYGLPYEPSYTIHSPVSMEDGYASCVQAIKSGLDFSAVIAQNEVVAIGVLHALEDHHIKVPDQVALISLGGSPVAKLTKPRVSVIDFSPYDMGFQAGKMVIEVIKKKRIRPSHTILPTKFVKGDTC